MDDEDAKRVEERKRIWQTEFGTGFFLKLALHRFFTFPADFESQTGLSRLDLAHSGLFLSYENQSMHCFFCTLEIMRLHAWKGLTLDQMNQKHSAESVQKFGHCCPLMAGEDVGDVPIVNPTNYNYEAHRLFSLLERRWTNPNVSVYDLAQKGFYFTGQDDNCRCWFCKLEVRGWEEGDTTTGEHKRWNPRCSLLHSNGQMDNVPIGQELVGEKLDCSHSNPFVTADLEKLYGSPFKYHSFVKMCLPVESLNVSPVGEMKYRQYSTVQSRTDSFSNWPKQLVQRPEVLVEAGFFYTGVGDRVLCFQCGGGLKDWDPKDDPWVEHAKWYGSCPYLAMKKGREFINQVILTNKELTGQEMVSLTIRRMVTLSDRLNEANGKRVCGFVSHREERNVVDRSWTVAISKPHVLNNPVVNKIAVTTKTCRPL